MAKKIIVNIRRIGNSKGIVIPKTILDQMGLDKTAQMSLDGDVLVLSKPKQEVREGWAAAAEEISKAGEDVFVLGDFSNQADEDWIW